jgi:hypothetical protein
MLMLMKSQIEAMRALTYTAAGALDQAGHHPDPEQRAQQQAFVDLITPVVKAWCTERAVDIASLGVQIHGGMGFIEETGAAQFYRDARITTIYEGTTGIQAMDLVGRKVAAEGGATMRAVLARLKTLPAQLEKSVHADVQAMRDPMIAALDALTSATDWVVKTAPADMQVVAASAVPYLDLAGTTLGGALMAQSALIAAKHLSDQAGDAAFYQAKIATARFYADHVLSKAPSHARTVTTGGGSALALEVAQF